MIVMTTTTKKRILPDVVLFSSLQQCIKKRKGHDIQNFMQQATSEQSSSIEHDFYRKLTPIDVDQALYALRINPQRTVPSDDDEKSTVLLKPKSCDCCRLLRTLSPSRLLLPLARRGRPHISTRSHHLLCSNCSEIKRQQQIDILQTQQKYQCDENTIALSYNLDSLTDQEKKILLEETIGKLQMVLNNHPTIQNYDQDNFQFTYRTLQTTLDILSSSQNSN